MHGYPCSESGLQSSKDSARNRQKAHASSAHSTYGLHRTPQNYRDNKKGLHHAENDIIPQADSYKILPEPVCFPLPAA